MTYQRGRQPKCSECAHSKSFHGGDAERNCRALGCTCAAWEEQTYSVAEVAAAIGRGQTWVKDHAEELGGTKVKNQWRFPHDATLPDAERLLTKG